MQLTEKQKSEGWRILKFGEIAKSVSKRIDPTDTDLEVYVGLEHLDPYNLRITRRGVPNDVKGEKLLVKPGQIIFGKRRAYQRKVAVADFEGICSAHAMVLEAIPEAVVPEYLPFFMQSDMFMERAIAISEGSLSPTIKWKTLANQEFPLPPRPRQEEILDVLNAFESSIEASQSSFESLQKLRHVLENDLFEINDFIKVGELCDVKTGGTPSRSKPSYWGGNIKWMSSGEIHNRFITDTSEKITNLGAQNSNARLLPENTVFIAMNGQGKTRGTVAISRCELTCNQSLAALICDEKKILPDFLYFYLRTQYQNIRNLTGEGRNGLNLKLVRSIQIPLIDLKHQETISKFSSEIAKQSEILEDKKNQTIQMKMKVIKSYLEGAA